MPTMYSGMGGAQGYGEGSYLGSTLTAGDADDGSVLVDVTSVFGPSGINYFGTNYTSIYINSNGNLTFDAANVSYVPSGIPATTEPMVAPFFTDIDVSAGSATGSNNIYWDLDATNGTFTVTWLDVEPYEGTGTNSFQLRLTDTGSGGFDLEFIYEDIGFADGYPSVNSNAGAPATAGFTDGGSNVYELPGSGNETALASYPTTDFNTSDPPGVYSQGFNDGGTPICFVAGTLIETADGPRPVETLVAGDRIRVAAQARALSVLWVGRQKWTCADLLKRPNARPVRIAAGALGPGQPARTLWLSPQHRVLCRSPLVAQVFGVAECLAPAKSLTALPGIHVPSVRRDVTYVHLMLERHAVIRAEGAWSESFLPRPYGLRLLGRRRQVCREAMEQQGMTGIPARRLLSVREGRALAGMHKKQGLQVCVTGGVAPARASRQTEFQPMRCQRSGAMGPQASSTA